MSNLYVRQVSAIGGNETSGDNPKRPAELVIKQGDTVEKLAKQFGMSKEDFKTWAGITGPLKAGQTYTLPTMTVPKGRGLFAVWQESGMTKAEFCKLNGIKDFDTYKCSEGEIFYIKRKSKKESGTKKTSTSAKTAKNPEQSDSRAPVSQDSRKNVSRFFSSETMAFNFQNLERVKQKWGSVYTPKELADRIYELADKYRAAVGKKDFDALINQINPKNVKEVLLEFDKKTNNEKSLINTITSETHSKKNARKDAVMHIYDALAKAEGFPEEKRVEFEAELDSQFNKLFGKVNTEKLEDILFDRVSQNVSESQIASEKVPDSAKNMSPLKQKLYYPSEEYLNKIVQIGGTSHKIRDLQSGAVSGAKRDPAFSDVAPQNRYIIRPYPYVNENGQIEATSEVRIPTSSKGPLKGKVIIINAGHGGYCPANGFFDAGTVLSVKNAEGNEMPIEEWRVADMYAEELTSKLQAKGATVVFVSGAVRNGGMSSSAYLENLLNGNRGDNEVKKVFKNAQKSDILFMSIHVESVKSNPGSKACTVRACRDDAGDNTLANNVITNVSKKISILKPDKAYNDYYVTKAMGQEIPAVLVELGNIANKDVKAALLSRGDRDKYTEALSQAIIETLNNDSQSAVSKPAGDKSKTKLSPERSKYIKETLNNPHTVIAKDTLEKIAKKYGVSVNAIVAENNISKDAVLRIGQVLKIPPKQEIKDIKNLKNVSEFMGVSLDFIKKLKRIEDDAGIPDDKFRNTPYPDAGGWSIGIGHFLGKNEPDKNMKISDAQVCTYLAQDLLKAEDELIGVIGVTVYNKLSKPMKEALLDMTFNKGPNIVKPLVDDLNNGNYASAITKMNYIRENTGEKAERSGLAKRRLFDMSIACGMYNKASDVPKSVKNAAQALYNKGVALLREECQNNNRKIENMLVGFNKDIQDYFGDKIKLSYVTK